eukprot:1160501-Pelagomonas_calceolata.AAC.11
MLLQQQSGVSIEGVLPHVSVSMCTCCPPVTSGTSVGVGFAIPGDMVTRIVPQLISNGRVVRPSLGIQARQQPRFTASLLACNLYLQLTAKVHACCR